MKILLRNISKGWFSLATHNGTRLEMKVNATKLLDIDESVLKYYKQFIPLGIAIEVLKEVEEQPIIEQPIIENHINDMVLEEVREEDINKVAPEYEGFVEQDLVKLTKVQLRELCTSLGISWTNGMLKKDLINRILKEFPVGD